MSSSEEKNQTLVEVITDPTQIQKASDTATSPMDDTMPSDIYNEKEIAYSIRLAWDGWFSILGGKKQRSQYLFRRSLKLQ
jgi:hypothetical protein